MDEGKKSRKDLYDILGLINLIAFCGHLWKQTEHPPQYLLELVVIALLSLLNFLINNGQNSMHVPQEIHLSNSVTAL
jgi:hypothetical protein